MTVGARSDGKRAIGDPVRLARPRLLRVFPQLARARIEHAWSGHVAVTRDRLPRFGRVAPNGFYAHGFCGHGVVLSQIAGRLLADRTFVPKDAIVERDRVQHPVAEEPVGAVRLVVIEQARGRVQRINSGVNALLGNRDLLEQESADGSLCGSVSQEGERNA